MSHSFGAPLYATATPINTKAQELALFVTLLGTSTREECVRAISWPRDHRLTVRLADVPSDLRTDALRFFREWATIDLQGTFVDSLSAETQTFTAESNGSRTFARSRTYTADSWRGSNGAPVT